MKKFREFREAKECVRSLGIKGQREYYELRKSGKIPDSLPYNPHTTYKGKGWMGWGDFLGTGNIANFNKEFLPFEEAREYVRSLGIKGVEEYHELRKSGKIPHSFPSSPHITYKGKGWMGWGDFLGNGRTRYNSKPFPFLPFGEAREYVRNLGIKNQREYQELRKSGKIPDSLPSTPDRTYKGKGWKGWGDFLGTGNIAPSNKEFLPFEEARKYVRSLGIKGQIEYRELRKSDKIPHSLPSAPDEAYKVKGWKGWGDFLGNIKESYTLTKEEVKVVKDMNKVDSTLSKIKSMFNRLIFFKQK